MDQELPTDPLCAVCGRRLLHGERPIRFITGAGTEVIVCELCKARAEAAGWLRPEEADAIRASGGSRERRRPRSQMLGGLLSRLPAGAGAGGENGEEGGAPPARSSRQPPGAAEAGGLAGGGASAPAARTPADPLDAATGVAVPQALVAFNTSNHRRTVAGLTRTLGPPRASGLAVRVSSGQGGVRLTVAWELTWYQWEVAPGGRGIDVRESGKGETIDQLRSADRSWNLTVSSDGTLAQRPGTLSDGSNDSSAGP